MRCEHFTCHACPDETDFLRREVESYRKAHGSLVWAEINATTAKRKAEEERDAARAEVERMRGIEAKLRAALEQIAFPRATGSAFHEEAVAIARRVL